MIIGLVPVATNRDDPQVHRVGRGRLYTPLLEQSTERRGGPGTAHHRTATAGGELSHAQARAPPGSAFSALRTRRGPPVPEPRPSPLGRRPRGVSAPTSCSQDGAVVSQRNSRSSRGVCFSVHTFLSLSKQHPLTHQGPKKVHLGPARSNMMRRDNP